MSLIYTYRDGRGLRIRDEDIIKTLEDLDLMEDEVINFLGKERMEMDGFANSFIQTLSRQDQFYKARH